MKQTTNLRLLVICHKYDKSIRKTFPYFPLHVGKALHPDVDLGFPGDNSGDNISERNPQWCELTGLYWGWKNIHDVKYLGMCHYRRYFDMDVSMRTVEKFLKDHDMIVIDGGKMADKTARARNLMYMTSQEDTYLFIDTILALHPEYREAVRQYFFDSRFSYPFTMFIADKKIYDEYCEFLFPILFETERRLRPHGYTRQKRTMGYFGEWSLGLFIMCRHLKVKVVPVQQCGIVNPKQNLLKRTAHKLKLMLLSAALSLLKRPPHEIVVPEHVRVGFKCDNIELRALE